MNNNTEIKEKFENYLQLDKSKIKYKNINEQRKDLFTLKRTHCLAHCFSRDFHMNNGIAKRFNDIFNNKDYLIKQNQKVGGLAVLPNERNFIYYLITEENYYNKPTLFSLFNCTEKLKIHMLKNNVNKLAIPRIGCGLDKLNWDNEVKPMIQYIFENTNIEITVCNFMQAIKINQIMIEARTEKIIKLPVINENNFKEGIFP